ncbi:MAG: SwmB domain-containing protein [Alphaproteobacteria bacterium]|nr:SwmB domain-containing protein [Alphaproteobacteria bacterium]
MDNLPDGLSNTRSGSAWYQDHQGLIHKVTESNMARFGTIYGSARGALVEIAVTAQNLYSRPSSETITDHISGGTAIASITTDATSPCRNLANGQSIWVFDNTSGEIPVDIDFIGSISSGKASAMAYIKTLLGDGASLSISGNGTEDIGHNVSGYVLHRVEDRSVSTTENLRITVPAGTLIHVACVNLQAYDCLTSFIDTEGSPVTRNGDDLNGTDVSWWSDVPEGTFIIDFTHMDDDGETGHVFEVRDNATENRFTLWQSSGVFKTSAESGNVAYVNENSGAIFNKTRVRMALSYKDGQLIQARNGDIDFDLTPTYAPDVSTFSTAPYPLSFLSINRSGAAPINGIVHSFALYDTAFDAQKLRSVTNPNTSNELWITMFGDSNLLRWKDYYGSRPQQRFIDRITAHLNSDIYVINKGDSSSAANYTGAAAQGVDYWSNNGDAGGGTSWLQAIGPDGDGGSIVNDTYYQKRKIDYILMNIAAGDVISIANSTINKGDYKASMQNILDITTEELGVHVKFIVQYPPNANNGAYTDSAMQDVRDALRELAAEDNRIIGAYELYDAARTDGVHPNEDGFNRAADRAADIILAHLGAIPAVITPEVIAAKHNGNTITITLPESCSMTGEDTTPFYVEVDSTPITVNTALCAGNKVTLTLSQAMTSEQIVQLWIGYGHMSSLNPSKCIIDENTQYPINSLAAFNVIA